MTAYYNENDPFAAQWLRNLVEAGHIAPGYVDERDMLDVAPQDLAGFTQCHFFAGIGGWSLALRKAGWPDNRPVWTGSCPCQPFSAAGKGAGFDDERHLWPAFHWLIQQRRPAIVFGEQVSSKAAEPWLDLVQADLEALDYAFGCIPFPSAGVGAPHIRDRAYWAAHNSSERLAQRVSDGRIQRETVGSYQGQAAISSGHAGGLENPDSERRDGEQVCLQRRRSQQGCVETAGRGEDCRPDPTNGFWRDADWIFCRDSKWRPVEPGSQPLVDGIPGRVALLRGYGNAINVELAAQFIQAFEEAVIDLLTSERK